MTVAPLPFLIVTGFAPEARIAEGPGVVVVNAGGSPARLRALLEGEPAPAAYQGVISFGIAGGLAPELSPGTVVAGTAVLAGDRRWPTHPDVASLWAKRLADGGERVVIAAIAGADTQMSRPADKEALRSATGAAAVDMESHVAAAFAATHRLPFAALRVVCDPAGRGLPPLATNALRPDGRIDFAAVFRSLVRQPAQIAALPGLARDAAKALAVLGRVRAALGPGFGLGGLGFAEPLGDVL